MRISETSAGSTGRNQKSFQPRPKSSAQVEGFAAERGDFMVVRGLLPLPWRELVAGGPFDDHRPAFIVNEDVGRVERNVIGRIGWAVGRKAGIERVLLQ